MAEDEESNSLQGLLKNHKFQNTGIVPVIRPLPIWATQPTDSKHRDMVEYYNLPEDFINHTKQVANLIRKSKHVVVYTGAGISTSASIPDYRGPDGLWTQLEKGIMNVALKDLDQAKPTLAHCGLTELVKRGFIHFITSTNLDGLHLRSGLPEDKIAELHGNTYKESCEKCHTHYHRAFDCSKTGTRSDHWTGRYCENCGGRLLDNIINFGELLPEDHLNRATAESHEADLAIVMGTSMLVTPACILPGNAAKMVICNLQKTPYDDTAILLLRGKTDTFIKLLLIELGVEIPKINPQGQTVDDTTGNWEKEHELHQKK